MKKHILGAALFSFIVASFAIIFAFFYSPSLPPKEAVKPPVSQIETVNTSRSYCNMRSDKFSYEVISSELDGFILISRVRMSWKGAGRAPEKVFLRPVLFTLDQKGSGITLVPTAFNGVFKNQSEATIVIATDLDIAAKMVDEKKNWYVNYEISEDYPSGYYSKPNLSEAHQVLFNHDKK